MTKEQLSQILTDHADWLKDKGTGKRADLSRADLIGADLNRADLSRANLRRAVLSGADLSGADLSSADLSNADLIGADLRRSDLSWADLSGADLIGADLSGADLNGADLRVVNLNDVNLNDVNLRGANLSCAISNNHTFLAVYGIGSANRQTLYIPEMDIVFCGCFKGTMTEFKAQVANNATGKHLEAYNNAIEYLEKQTVIYRKDSAAA